MTTNRFRVMLQEKIDASPLTVAKIARLADMSDQTIYNFLSGKSDTLTGNLEKILNVLENKE